jgi:hypothetical protein
MKKALSILAVVLLVAALAAAGQQPAKKLKVFISVDMEGIAGLIHWDETGEGGADYPLFRKLMTEEANAAIAAARAAGRPIVAVGTTVTRTLESLARDDARIEAAEGSTDLVIAPGHRFAVVTHMLTNFHLPRSSLLMLVCCFGGRERVLRAYAEAVAHDYRFYSYGDCMLVTREATT